MDLERLPNLAVSDLNQPVPTTYQKVHSQIIPILTVSISNNIKVGHVIDNLAAGGAQTWLLELIQHSDCDHRIYNLGQNDSLKKRFQKHCEVIEFKGRFHFDPRVIFNFPRNISKSDTNILHTHLPYSHIVGRLGSPFTNGVVATYHNIYSEYFGTKKVKYLHNLTSKIDDKKVACSTGVLNSFNGQDGWTRIANGIDVENFAKRVDSADSSVIHSKYKINKDSYVILNVGRYTPQKNQIELIKSMPKIQKQISNVHLLLVGRGEMKDILKNEIVRIGMEENITVTGYVDDIYKYYSRGDIFILPSLYEGMPITLLEAMSAKLPVIASNISGVNEIITHEKTGLLLKQPNAKSISKQTLDIHDMDSKALVKNAYDNILENHSIEVAAKKYDELYKEMA